MHGITKSFRIVLATCFCAALLLASALIGAPAYGKAGAPTSQSSAALEFLYLDSDVLTAGETQYVAFGLADESVQIQNAQLCVKRASTQETFMVEAEAVEGATALFALEFATEDADAYTMVSITYTAAGVNYEVALETMEQMGALIEDEAGEVAVVPVDADGAPLEVENAADSTVAEIVEETAAAASSADIPACSFVVTVPTAEEALELAESQVEQDEAEGGSEFLTEAEDLALALLGIENAGAKDDFGNLIIAVDPGHGGSEPGAVYYGFEERDLTWAVATALVDELNTYTGVIAFTTLSYAEFHSNNTYGRKIRIENAVEKGADAVVSIHFNATERHTANGCEVWVPHAGSRYYYEETHVAGKALGEKIAAKLAALGLKNLGIKTKAADDGETFYPDGSVGDYYGINLYAREHGIPGITVEHCYMDNSSDAAFLKKSGSLKKLALADAEGIAAYYGLSKTPQVNPDIAVDRIAGTAAADTAIAISRANFADVPTNTVMLVRDDDFADAMSASGLAGTLNASILLVDRTSGIDAKVAAEIEQLGATEAYIIGGPAALTEDLEGQLAEMGFTTDKIHRLYGENAWDTSVVCAQANEDLYGNQRDEAIVAMSSNFQDALSISSFAYKHHVPILLENQDFGATGQLTEEAQALICTLSRTIYVVGGDGAVPMETVEGLDVFAGRKIVRLAGYTGYDTSHAIATYMVEHELLSPSIVTIASGALKAKGTDALAGAALAGRSGGVILLANPQTKMEREAYNAIIGSARIIDPDTGEWEKGQTGFLKANIDSVDAIHVLGGTYVMPATFYNSIVTLTVTGVSGSGE